jgi:5-methylcytosine-specific restriction endonuclease McrA
VSEKGYWLHIEPNGPGVFRRYSTRRKVSPGKRKRVIGRDGGCKRCGPSEYLEIHHIKAVVDGGTNDMDNLMALCRDCHEWETSFQWHARFYRDNVYSEFPG